MTNYLLTLIDAGNILETRQNGGSIKLFKNRKSGKNVLRNQIDDYQEYLDESNDLKDTAEQVDKYINHDKFNLFLFFTTKNEFIGLYK